MTRPSSKGREALQAGQPLAPEDVVVWNWPLREEGLKSWAILAASLVLIAVVWAVSREIWLTLLTALALIVSLWRLWLPVRWELGLTGITLTALGMRRRIAWMTIARYELARDGVWLYADREPSPQRGTFIAYAGQREQVTACVNYYLGTWTSAAESTQTLPH